MPKKLILVLTCLCCATILIGDMEQLVNLTVIPAILWMDPDKFIVIKMEYGAEYLQYVKPRCVPQFIWEIGNTNAQKDFNMEVCATVYVLSDLTSHREKVGSCYVKPTENGGGIFLTVKISQSQ